MPIYLKRYISKITDDSAVTNLYKFTPQSSKVLSAKGELFGLITVSKTPKGYATKGTKFVWDSVMDSYFSSSAGSIVEDIKRALSAGSKKLLELIKFDKEIAQQGIDLSFTIVAIKDSTAYIGIFGEQQVYIIRGEQWISISDILVQNRAVAASIAITPDDVIFLGSPSSMSKLSKQGDSSVSIRRIEREGDPFDVGEGVVFLSRHKFDAQDVVVPVIDEYEKQQQELPEVEIKEQGIEIEKVEIEKEAKVEEKGSDKLVVYREKLSTFFLKTGDLWAKIKNVIILVWNKLKVVFSPLGKVFMRLFDSISRAFWRLFDDKYGRKLWYKRLRSKLSSVKLWGGESAYGMRIDGYKETSIRGKRIGMLIVAVILVGVVLLGLKLSMNAKEAREIHSQAVTILTTVDNNIKQAENSLPGDTASAETFLFSANEELKKLDGKKLSLDDGKKVNDFKTKIQSLDDRVAKRTIVSESNESFELYFDSRISLGDNSKPSDIVIYKDEFQTEQLFVVDEGLGGVYKINLYDKSYSKIPDSKGVLKKPRYADIGTKGLYVYDDTVGVVRSLFGANSSYKDFQKLSGLERDDLSVDDISEFAVFTESDNVYLLSPSQNTILKASFSGSGYGLPSTYITSDTFVNAHDFFGDYAIYVLTNSADGLERFSYNYQSGKVTSTPVSIVGLSPDLSSPTSGFTGGTLDNYLYIFDSANKRITSFEKPNESGTDQRHPNEMHLIKQYVYRGGRDNVFENVSDIVVDSQEKNMYVLDGTTVWRISL